MRLDVAFVRAAGCMKVRLETGRRERARETAPALTRRDRELEALAVQFRNDFRDTGKQAGGRIELEKMMPIALDEARILRGIDIGQDVRQRIVQTEADDVACLLVSRQGQPEVAAGGLQR